MSGGRKIWLVLGIPLVVGLLCMAAVVHWTTRAGDDNDIPVVEVKRGDLDSKIYAAGELRASHSAMLSAPQIGGGSLQITHLLHTGTPVKKGLVAIEFDPSEQQYKLEQSRSELEEAVEEIIKAKADALVQAALDKVALLEARFNVRRAELEVGKNELASAIAAKKNEMALDQARRALTQLEQDIGSHSVSGRATIGLAEEKRHKAKLGMDQAQQNIEKMKIHAPMDGLVAIEKNEESGDNWSTSLLPDYHEGDQTAPGTTIARIIDPGDMEVSAKLDERERNNVEVGQAAEIHFDALPGQTFKGTVKTVAGIGSKNFWEGGQAGHFEVTVQVQGSNPLLRAGFTVQLVIAGEVRKDVLYIPRQAVFVKDGKRIVYVRNGSGFNSREIQVIGETASRAAVDGLAAGTEVAFIDPSPSRKPSGRSSTEPSLSGGTR
jgi:HlyD family secretion protein